MIIDLHCDHLYKLQHQTNPALDTSIERLLEGRVQVQAFALFIEPHLPTRMADEKILEQIVLFHEQVLSHPQVVWIRQWEDLDTLHEHQLGAFLTLEGVDCIGNELEKLHHLLDAGVMSVGLTWNPANLAADGCEEPRGAGLTKFGRDIIEVLNQRGILTDMAHLAEAGFWEVLELAKYPIVSHANARALFDHPRNLTDKQINALIERKIPLHLVFYPPFLTGRKDATVEDLIHHLHHILALGGEDIVAFGSDFDGIEFKVTGLEHAEQFQNLTTRLAMELSSAQLEKISHKNFRNYIARHFKKETSGRE